MSENSSSNSWQPDDSQEIEQNEPAMLVHSIIELPFFSYNNGFANGVFQMAENSGYENFIKANEEKELTRKLLEKNKARIEEKRRQESTVRDRRLDLERQAIDKKMLSNLAHVQMEATQNQTVQLGKQLEVLQEQNSKIESEYKWLNAFLLLTVGVIFLMTDVLISKDIFEKYFDLSNFDSWLLGSSVALTGFALKPTIDRIFEKPYRENEKIIRNHSFLITISLLAIVLLGLMGWIRPQAYKNLSTLNTETAASPKKDRWKNINAPAAEETPKAESELTKSMTSKEVYAIFVIGSILFALTGAACLSIGFKSADPLWSIYNNKKNISRLKNKVQEGENKCSDLLKQYHNELAEFDKITVELKTLPVLSDVEKQLTLLEDEEKQLLKILAEATAAREIAWYQQGLLRGKQFKNPREPFVSPVGLERWVVPYTMRGFQRLRYRPASVAGPGGRESNSERGRTYLYEQIRDAISIHDNKQLKSTSNGSLS